MKEKLEVTCDKIITKYLTTQYTNELISAGKLDIKSLYTVYSGAFASDIKKEGNVNEKFLHHLCRYKMLTDDITQLQLFVSNENTCSKNNKVSLEYLIEQHDIKVEDFKSTIESYPGILMHYLNSYTLDEDASYITGKDDVMEAMLFAAFDPSKRYLVSNVKVKTTSKFALGHFLNGNKELYLAFNVEDLNNNNQKDLSSEFANLSVVGDDKTPDNLDTDDFSAASLC